MYNYFKLKYKNFSEKKISYSYGGIDALINNIFKKQSSGFYVDVDLKNIETFNYARPQDYNVNIGVSNKEGVEKLFFTMINHQSIF